MWSPAADGLKTGMPGLGILLKSPVPLTYSPSTRLGSRFPPIQPTFDPPYGVRRPLRQMELLLMATGTVKWFNSQKGYGFIQPESGGADVFVHISAVERAGMDNLNEGQKLSYELEQGQRGRVSAVNLRPA